MLIKFTVPINHEKTVVFSSRATACALFTWNRFNARGTPQKFMPSLWHQPAHNFKPFVTEYAECIVGARERKYPPQKCQKNMTNAGIEPAIS